MTLIAEPPPKGAGSRTSKLPSPYLLPLGEEKIASALYRVNLGLFLLQRFIDLRNKAVRRFLNFLLSRV